MIVALVRAVLCAACVAFGYFFPHHIAVGWLAGIAGVLFLVFLADVFTEGSKRVVAWFVSWPLMMLIALIIGHFLGLGYTISPPEIIPPS